jgi:RsiW-degrading membrane proteinase PrsW (M82 family)
MSAEWFYLEDEEARGPLAAGEVRALIDLGKLSDETLVAQAGWDDWIAASEALPPVAKPPTPPPPVPPTAPEGGAGPAPEAAESGPRPVAAPAPDDASAGEEPSDEGVAVELRCVAGPDTGKSVWAGPTPTRLDREAGLSDPRLGAVEVVLIGDRVSLRVLEGDPMLVDGRPAQGIELEKGNRLDIGSSTWQIGTAPMRIGDLTSMLGDRLNQLANLEKLEGFSLSEMFSEVFHRRTAEEIDEYFLAGTTKTTPSLSEVETGWPKPWLFGRVLVFLAVVYTAFFISFRQFGNPRLLPGLILMGSLAVPFSTLILFFELNTPRNVSFIQVLKLFILGGVVSLFVSLLGFSVADLSWLGASSAGIIEEIGKLATVVLIVRGQRNRFILNGLLFGAAVGAGFAAFESAGYAFWDAFARTGSIDETARTIMLRALLSPLGHVAWTAIAAGALWRVKGGKPFELSMLFDASFLKTFLIPVALHMLWNSPIPSPMYSKYLLLGFIGWLVVFGLVQEGLRQIKQEQTDIARRQVRTTGSFRTMKGLRAG